MNAPLEGRRVLVVEDRYLIAMEMEAEVCRLGGVVVGPARNVDQAEALLAAGPVDLALLDVNLDGERVFPVARRLVEQDVPFIFLTGYDDWVLPEEWAGRPRLSKPVSAHVLGEELARLAMQAGRAP